uniref:G_PROTEIN_RECEP_F1_2 domain-containing protein n=1 Tax=Heterorhabditis bacteriophora TaxID=37862 RepID=A0A1I7XAK2_HETBA
MPDELTAMPELTISTDLEARFALYTGFGVFVCIANLITITVFSSSKEFLQRYIVFNALAVADLVKYSFKL